ncbi:transglutaminase-like domain-containing protein [Phaeobacter porticola]|uniref:Transglutaminase-like enzyme, putative cysteine protease n=1 Tax=Phaeobacter porticola TaxID=1844006 RepID=A0A1L3I1H4_9RHOB|nr:transglutaminase family protein [Phaeobacter porticola]APG45944.1 Transglutaminase-like enzyme, putative cysteine protease [Phaeobacter porticola]
MSDVAHLTPSTMLDFRSPAIVRLISQRGWLGLRPSERIGAAYDFVSNEILFGYNMSDTRRASQVLADGYGQCNTKATLLMALLRGLGIPCRLHGFTIDKSLQRGVVPELVYWMAPQNILHSWVEVRLDGRWINLEGFILDNGVLVALQAAFPGRNSLCAYGAGTDCLQSPQTVWHGQDTYIQKTGINADLGLFESPDAFYAHHQQALTGLRRWLYRNGIRHWMNRRVALIRRGLVPKLPGGEATLNPSIRKRVFGVE